MSKKQTGKQDLEKALSLIETPDGFIAWLQHHREEQESKSILCFIAHYLHDCGITNARFYISTWPALHIWGTDAEQDIPYYWIINIQQYFGQCLERSVSGQEVLDALVDNPTGYSLIKKPPQD